MTTDNKWRERKEAARGVLAKYEAGYDFGAREMITLQDFYDAALAEIERLEKEVYDLRWLRDGLMSTIESDSAVRQQKQRAEAAEAENKELWERLNQREASELVELTEENCAAIREKKAAEAKLAELEQALHKSYSGIVEYDRLRRDIASVSGIPVMAKTWSGHIEAIKAERDQLREETYQLQEKLREAVDESENHRCAAEAQHALWQEHYTENQRLREVGEKALEVVRDQKNPRSPNFCYPEDPDGTDEAKYLEQLHRLHGALVLLDSYTAWRELTEEKSNAE